MTAAQPPCIGLLDSGAGGLTVWQAIHQRLPGLAGTYLYDNAGFPYGTRTAAELRQRLLNLVGSFIEQHAPALMVIACNTASTLVLQDLRHHFKVPFVGVVPAIKTAGALSKNRCIGLLATPETINRPYVERLKQDFAADCTMLKIGSNELVELAEQALTGRDVSGADVRPILAPWLNAPLVPDTLVLGCTHFPLLRQHIAGCFPQPPHLVDSADAIARRVAHVLAEMGVMLADVERPQRTASLRVLATQQQGLPALAPHTQQRFAVSAVEPFLF